MFVRSVEKRLVRVAAEMLIRRGTQILTKTKETKKHIVRVYPSQ